MNLTRDSIFNYLDEYVNNSKSEIDNYRTNQSLLKSYIFETFNDDSEISSRITLRDNFRLEEIFELQKLDYKQIDEGLFLLGDSRTPYGYLELINNRFFTIYSLQNADITDKFATGLSKNSTFIDSLWISGKMFNSFLNQVKELHHPRKYIKMNFEYQNLFNFNSDNNESEPEEDYLFSDEPSKITLSKEIGQITEHIGAARKLFPEFNSITSMRFPTYAENGKGGHLFYHNGKVTNRSNNFYDHRFQIKQTVKAYQKVTEDIEYSAWLDYETIKSPQNDVSMSFKGRPIVFKFEKEISKNVLRNFVNNIIAKGKEPFRILAEPKWVKEDRAHIYGLDLHLWQEVIMDLGINEFIIFLPRGTCGNTIHRLATNIQRFIQPSLEVWIGNTKYEDMINKNLTIYSKGDNFYD